MRTDRGTGGCSAHLRSGCPPFQPRSVRHDPKHCAGVVDGSRVRVATDELAGGQDDTWDIRHAALALEGLIAAAYRFYMCNAPLGLLMVGCACAALACPPSATGPAGPTVIPHVAPFPSGCQNRTTGLIVVDLSRGRNDRLSAWAQSFASDYGIAVSVVYTLDSLPAEAFDPERSQWKLEALHDFVWTAAAAEDVRAIAMGVLMEDAYTTRNPDWRWSFGVGTWRLGKTTRDTWRHTLVVSTWRMNPTSYGRPRNDALADERLSKFVVRQLGGLHCGLKRDGDNASPMRPTILGVNDLDEIDRSAW